MDSSTLHSAPACNANAFPARILSGHKLRMCIPFPFPPLSECGEPLSIQKHAIEKEKEKGRSEGLIVFAIFPLFFSSSCHPKITTWTKHITFPENNGDAHAQARQHLLPLFQHLLTNHGGWILNCEPSNESVFKRSIL